MTDKARPNTDTDDETGAEWGAADDGYGDMVAALKAAEAEEGDPENDLGEIEAPEPRDVVTEEDAADRIAAAQRPVSGKADSAEEKPEGDEPPAAEEKPAAPAPEAPAQPADPDAFLADIPEAHRERVKEAVAASRYFAPIEQMAVARGIPPAQAAATVKALVELNDFANRDLHGYVAHVAGLTGHADDASKLAFVKGVAEKLGVDLAPPAPEPEAPADDDELFSDPAVKALKAEIAALKAAMPKAQPAPPPQQFAPQPAAPSQPDPAAAQRAQSIKAFVDETGPDQRPLRPHWGALHQGGFISAAINEMKAEKGAQALDADPKTLGDVYVRAMVLNPATRAMGMQMLAAMSRPASAPSPQRGKGAAKIIDASQGAPKTPPPTETGDASDVAWMASQLRANGIA